MPPKINPTQIADQMEHLTTLFSDALTEKQKHIDLPVWDNDIDVWFTRVENTFRLYGSSISSEQKAVLIINKVPSSIVRELTPDLDTIYASRDPYGEAKKCLFNISGRTNVQRIRATYQLTQDPTKSPRQLLAELQQRWGYNTEVRRSQTYFCHVSSRESSNFRQLAYGDAQHHSHGQKVSRTIRSPAEP